MTERNAPVVIITGAAGNIGNSLIEALKRRYRVVSLDRAEAPAADFSFICDLTAQESIDSAFRKIRSLTATIAAVVHLAAYFDFTGEESPLYDKVNVEGTRRLLRALRSFKVERFIYSSTMLVHRPGKPGERINEESPIEPRWAYPKSKAQAEAVIVQEAAMPYTILRLAGLYDERTAVPTLSQQIARIYEKDMKSRLYSGDVNAGQAFIHRDDMIDAFVRVIDRRNSLPAANVLLVGEPETVSYDELQDLLGGLIHGEHDWRTLRVPPALAKAGAWLEEKSEPLVPDDFDRGHKPFIRPFMIDMASDHYELDTGKAQSLLHWRARHRIRDVMPEMIEFLKRDPAGWYRANRVTPPDWIGAAAEKNRNPQRLLERYQAQYRQEYDRNRWAHFMNIALACWLLTSSFALGYGGTAMSWSDIVSGLLLLPAAAFCLSPRFPSARWICGAIGLWVMFAPLVFWTPSAAAYLNGTLAGALITGFAIVTRPAPGMSPTAAMTGPTLPPGWDFSPSTWMERLPIIAMAFVGFFISRYLTAYQLGHIDGVWEPFFPGAAGDPKNGTEEIITSWVSEAWPVPDAGLGAYTYMLEILTGLLGSARRWRTMPWLVVLFGFMIVPLGVVSITFIIIQPIVLGTWCTLCLIAAAAMLIQIPYSLDELLATGQFLYRRKRAGRPLLLIFFTGDTDEGEREETAHRNEFAQSPRNIVEQMLGSVRMTWNLGLCILIGLWLMFTRLTLGNDGGMADIDHLVGALVITIAVSAFAEVGRPLRFLIIPLGAVLLVTPFIYDPGAAATVSSLVCGAALIAFSLPRGRILKRYGNWNRFIV